MGVITHGKQTEPIRMRFTTSSMKYRVPELDLGRVLAWEQFHYADAECVRVCLDPFFRRGALLSRSQRNVDTHAPTEVGELFSLTQNHSISLVTFTDGRTRRFFERRERIETKETGEVASVLRRYRTITRKP